MTLTEGMDTRRVQDIAGRVRGEALRLQGVEEHGSVGARVLSHAWHGDDVAALLARWDRVRGQIDGAVSSLRDAADAMDRQVEEQVAASGGSGSPRGATLGGERGSGDERRRLWRGAPVAFDQVPRGLTRGIDLGPGASPLADELGPRRPGVEEPDPPTPAEQRSREAARADRDGVAWDTGIGLSGTEDSGTVAVEAEGARGSRAGASVTVTVNEDEWAARAGVEAGVKGGLGGGLPRGPFIEVEGEAKGTVSAGVSVPPGTVDPQALDPFDPSDAPVGTVWDIEATAEAKKKGALGYRQVGLSGTNERVLYDKTSVEVVEEGKVRITRGNGLAVDNENSLRLGRGVNLELGTGSQGDVGASESVVVDVSTPEGKAAYDRYLATGEWPQETANGSVSGTTVLETADWEQTRNVGVNAGPGSVSSEDVVYRHNSTTETLPDGSQQVVRIASTDNGSMVEHNQVIEADGTVRSGDYTYSLAVDDPAYAERIENAYGIHVEPGETVEITVSEEEMAAMQEASAAQANQAPADPTASQPGVDPGTYSSDLLMPTGDGTVDELQRAWAEVEPGTNDGTVPSPGSARVTTG